MPPGTPTAAQGYMQDVTDRRHDSRRLELLVGILSLAADETPPDEIVAAAAQNLAALFGDVEVTYVEPRKEGGYWIRYTTDKGRPEFWDQVEWSRRVRRAPQAKGQLIVEDVTKEAWLEPVRERLLERDVASSVDVPLLRNGEITGVLWFNSSRPRKWGINEVSVLVTSPASSRSSSRTPRRASSVRPPSATCATVTRSSVRSAARPSGFSRSRTSTKRSSS